MSGDFHHCLEGGACGPMAVELGCCCLLLGMLDAWFGWWPCSAVRVAMEDDAFAISVCVGVYSGRYWSTCRKGPYDCITGTEAFKFPKFCTAS